MNDVNKLEQVKTELADAIRVWYLRHAEDIAGNAGKDAEFSQTYDGNGETVSTWAGDLAEGARFQGLAFADVYKTVGGLKDFEQVAGDAAKTIEQAARGKIAADLNITAGPAAFKVDDGRRD